MDKFSVIAAVKNEEEFKAAIESNVKIIFHLSPNIINLNEDIKFAHKNKKHMFIHMDLMEGIAKDKFGIKYVKSLGVDGIISTRSNIIKTAKEEKLFTVQRFFAVDTRSVDAIVETIKTSKADMIEVMPGIVPKVTERLKTMVTVPIIAGGLIDTQEEVVDAIKSGVYAISTGCRDLWGK